jgi:Putative helicase
VKLQLRRKWLPPPQAAKRKNGESSPRFPAQGVTQRFLYPFRYHPSLGMGHRGCQPGWSRIPNRDEVGSPCSQSKAMTERILYWLSLDMQVRALAERLLQRFAVTVSDLPVSAAHHHAKPGGLDRQSMEAPVSLAGAPELTRSYPLRPSPSKISLGRGDRFCRLDGH